MNLSNEDIVKTKNLAQNIRIKSLQMVNGAKSSHIGSCLSVADLLAVLQALIQVNDGFLIFSKGHAAAALYASLHNYGKISEEELLTFGSNGSNLIGHVNHSINGIHFSTGSLGHGLPIGVGVAVASKHKQVYVVMSDGELNEGTTWESLAIASQLGLANLTIIIDLNGIQSFGKTAEILDLEPLVDKFLSFKWLCVQIDGHSVSDIYEALTTSTQHKPKVIIARTIKGKGISEMEGKLEWHYRSPTDQQLNSFIQEIKNNA